MRRKIEKLLDERINPYVAGHGGKIELIDYINGDVHVQMTGGCQGCAASKMTLRQGVEQVLREEFGDAIKNVIDVTDHTDGSDPFYAS